MTRELPHTSSELSLTFKCHSCPLWPSGRRYTEEILLYSQKDLSEHKMSQSEELQRFTQPSKLPAAITQCARVIMGILPIAQLVVGAVYQNDCPRQPYIPIYLLVMGVVSLLTNILSFLPCFGNLSKALSFFLPLFVFCWFIAGNVWIYSIYEPSFNKTVSNMDTYCNKTLYLFAFWTTNLFYILLGFSIFICCCPWLLCAAG